MALKIMKESDEKIKYISLKSCQEGDVVQFKGDENNYFLVCCPSILLKNEEIALREILEYDDEDNSKMLLCFNDCSVQAHAPDTEVCKIEAELFVYENTKNSSQQKQRKFK